MQRNRVANPVNVMELKKIPARHLGWLASKGIDLPASEGNDLPAYDLYLDSDPALLDWFAQSQHPVKADLSAGKAEQSGPREAVEVLPAARSKSSPHGHAPRGTRAVEEAA